MREPFGLRLIALECDCHYIKHAFQASVRFSGSAAEVSAGGPYYASLLCSVYIFLRRCLYAPAAGLDLYKMYSNCVERYDVYLQMSAAPVPFEDGMPHALKQCACNVFSPLS